MQSPEEQPFLTDVATLSAFRISCRLNLNRAANIPLAHHSLQNFPIYSLSCWVMDLMLIEERRQIEA